MCEEQSNGARRHVRGGPSRTTRPCAPFRHLRGTHPSDASREREADSARGTFALPWGKRNGGKAERRKSGESGTTVPPTAPTRSPRACPRPTGGARATKETGTGFDAYACCGGSESVLENYSTTSRCGCESYCRAGSHCVWALHPGRRGRKTRARKKRKREGGVTHPWGSERDWRLVVVAQRRR